MKFSIYSELQTWPWKTQQQVYAEALEQCVNADRLGYSTYSIIEHFFFPKFGASPNPFAFFAKASERTRNINFRTLVHVLPYHNPAVLASQEPAHHLLGLALGGVAVEVEMAGVDPDDVRRVAVLLAGGAVDIELRPQGLVGQ
jgi:hypothetical protein